MRAYTPLGQTLQQMPQQTHPMACVLKQSFSAHVSLLRAFLCLILLGLGVSRQGFAQAGVAPHSDAQAAAAPSTAPAAAPAPATPAPSSDPAAATGPAPTTEEEAEPPPAGYAADGSRLPPAVTAPLVGIVLEKGTRNPLADMRVLIFEVVPPPPGEDPNDPKVQKARAKSGPPTAKEPTRELRTDRDGRFRVDDLSPGEYVIRLRGPGHQPSQSVETLTAGRIRTVTYYAGARSNPFESIVRAEPLRKEVSEQVLDVQELKRIPGTQNDPIKAVQNLPGVARAPFGGGLLVVWGSAPNDTRVYADGVLIPRIFHFGGFRATINAEFVSELTFKPGVYAADFGRGLGGIIDVKTRSPKADRIHGSVTLDLIDGSVTLEGPITKKLHVALGARVSWISVFLPIFNRSNIQVSPFYWDYQAALRYQPTTKDDLDLFVFGSTDNLSARIENPDPATNVDLDSRSYFGRALVRWTHRFSRDTSLFVMPSIGGDTVRFDLGDGGIGGVPFKLDILTLSYNLRSELRHRVTPWLSATAGIDLEGTRSSFDILSPPIPAGPSSSGEGGGGPPGGGAAALGLISSARDSAVQQIVRFAPYLIARAEFFNKRLIVSPQLRLDTSYLHSNDGQVSETRFTPEPRLFVSGQILPKYLLIKGGVGVYSQLAQPPELSLSFGNPRLVPQFGTTYLVGIESEPTSTLFIQGQFFYKDLRSMIVSDTSTRFNNGGLGRVVGGDFLLRQKLWRGLFGWVAYTISKSERKNTPDEPWRLFRFDQTHILTLVASYKLPWKDIEVGLRFRYVTGNPATPTIGALRSASDQNYAAIQGEVFSERLPDFHQLDLRIDKTWTFNRWKLGMYLDIQNLYNRTNTENLVYGGRQLFQSAAISGIPFFPNIGLRADF